MDSKRRFIPLVDVQEPTGSARICSTSCPFLGASADPVTPHGFPHTDNRCFKHQIGISRDFQFQSSYCLSDDYEDCSIYQNKEIPPVIEADVVETKKKLYFPTVVLLFIMVAIGSVALIYTSIYAWNNPKEGSTNSPALRNGIMPVKSKDNPQADGQSTIPVDQNETEVFNPESGEEPLQFDPALARESQPSASEGRGNFRAVTYQRSSNQE